MEKSHYNPGFCFISQLSKSIIEEHTRERWCGRIQTAMRKTYENGSKSSPINSLSSLTVRNLWKITKWKYIIYTHFCLHLILPNATNRYYSAAMKKINSTWNDLLLLHIYDIYSYVSHRIASRAYFCIKIWNNIVK